MSENKIDKSILLLSKNDEWCGKVYEYLFQHFKNVEWYTFSWGDQIGKGYISDDFDYIISYLCPCVVPQEGLNHAKEHAINFHPAPPRYPGIGGYNYAIWNGDETYGVMVHEMDEVVDSGMIYNVDTFPILKNETVKSLKESSMIALYKLFEYTIDSGFILEQHEGLKWHTPPYTRADFQRNCEIHLDDWGGFGIDVKDVVKDHIEGKIRAFYFPGARDYPYFIINGKKYKVTPVND